MSIGKIAESKKTRILCYSSCRNDCRCDFVLTVCTIHDILCEMCYTLYDSHRNCTSRVALSCLSAPGIHRHWRAHYVPKLCLEVNAEFRPQF